MKNFWFGKRVLVTGADGFVGAQLIKKLLQEGAVVVATMRHNRPISTLELLDTDNNGEVLRPDIEVCDLLDYQATKRVCDRHQIDTIFHLAATAIVSEAAKSPMSTVENNVMATLHLLEIARVNHIPRVVIASTDKAYGDHANDEFQTLPYKEHYTLKGLDVYSASKVCADVIAQTYAFQYKVPVAITRCCNVYGPGDLNFSRLIPKTIMLLLAGNSPIIHAGNAQTVREYLYIDDAVRAYMHLAENMEVIYGENHSNVPKIDGGIYGWAAFNISSDMNTETISLENGSNIRSVHDVITILRQKINDIEPVTVAKPEDFIEIPDQYLDATKIKNLGFVPAVLFDDGIELTLQWYTKNHPRLEKFAHKYII